MIGHQDPRQTTALCLSQANTQAVQKIRIIVRIKKDFPTFVSPSDHVKQATGDKKARLSWHGGKIESLGGNVNLVD